jgi:hypothetical protein
MGLERLLFIDGGGMELTLEQRREQRVLFEKALPVAKQSHWYDHNCTYGDAYVDGRWRSWCDAVEVNMPPAPETKPAITGELNNQYAKNVIAGALQALVAVGDADQIEGHRTRVLTRLQNGELGVYETAEYAERVKAADAEIAAAQKQKDEMRGLLNEQIALTRSLHDRLNDALMNAPGQPEVLDWPDARGWWWIISSGPISCSHVRHVTDTSAWFGSFKHDRVGTSEAGWQFIRATPPVFPGSTSC